MRVFIGMIWIFVWGSNGLQASEYPRIFHFDKKTYQAHFQNWSITQSAEGVMFFGNTDGLLEYDGAAWELHQLPENQTIRTVARGNDNLIYSGGYEEFGYWKRDRWGKLHYVSLSATLDDASLDQQEIWHILVSGKGIFFQSFGAVFFYDYKRIRRIEIPGTIMFLHEIDDQILAPVIDAGIYIWSPNEQWNLMPGSQRFAGKTIKVLLSDPGGLLAGTQEAGFFRYNGRTFDPWEHPLNATLAAHQINKAIRLQDGRIAVGTILNGVYILDGNEQALLHFNRTNHLQNNTILSLFEGQQGDLWIGLDQGIDVVALSDPLEYFEDTQGQLGTVYTAALYEGLLYLGTNQGLFYRPFFNKQQPDKFTLVPGTQGQVWQLEVFDGQLLCGHNQGTFRIQNRQAIPISQVTGGWQLLALPDNPDILLQGTYTGIAVFTKNKKGNWEFAEKLKGIENPICQLQADRKGYLWAINPNEGAFRLKLSQNGRQILRTDSIDTRSGLFTNYNLDLLQLDQEILIWSKDRYFRWDEQTGLCTPYFADRQKNHSTLRGKEMIMKNGDQFRIYPQRVAWLKNQKHNAWLQISLVKNNENIVSLNDSLYLFCLDNGYALISRKVRFNEPPGIRPLIRLVQPYRNGQPLGNHPGDGDLDSPNQTIRLPARISSFLVRFAMPLYTQTPSFRYRIPGWQSEWSPWSSQPFKEFSDLPPGEHILQVECNLSTEMAQLIFFVEPHWYQTWWAAFLFVLVAAGIFFLLYRMHHYRLKLQKRRLLLEKERQLHDQMLQARAEQLQADVINKSQELANSTFNLIRKNETLLQIKEALSRVKSDLGDRMPDKYHVQLTRLIDSHLDNEQDWHIFQTNFNQVHEVFLNKLKTDYPELTPGDLRLAAYLKMNLSSKEIAPLLNISIRGVENKRYRLRHKLMLDNDANLTEFLMQHT